MTPEHVLVGRHIVDAILHGMRWRLVVRVELEDLLRNEARIDEIAGCHEGKAGDQQGDCAHGASFVSAVGAIGTGCLKTACVARPQGAPHDIVQFCQTFIPVCTGPPRACARHTLQQSLQGKPYVAPTAHRQPMPTSLNAASVRVIRLESPVRSVRPSPHLLPGPAGTSAATDGNAPPYRSAPPRPANAPP